MKKIIIIAVSLIFLVQLSFAQQEQNRQLQRQLLNLYRKITELRSLATRYQDPRALEQINRALDLYRNALDNLKQTPPRYVLARTQFLKSKQLANQAAKILLFKPAVRYLRDLESLIQKAEIALHRNKNDDGRYMLSKSRAFQEEANRSIKNGQFLRAQEYYRISKFFAEKALNIANGGIITGKPFEDQLRNLNTLLFSLNYETIDDPIIKDLVKKIRESLEKAQTLYENGKIQQAFVQMRISERFIYRAIDLKRSGKTDEKDRLKENLYSLNRYIEAIEDELGTETDSPATKFLNKARNFYAEAEQALAASQPGRARNRIFLSQRMASKAMQFTKTTDQGRIKNNLEQRVRELDQLLKLQGDNITSESREGIRILHNEATQLLSEIQKDLEQNKLEMAFQKTRLCARLLNRIERILNRTTEEAQNNTQVRTDLDRVKNLLNKIQQNQQIDDTIRSQVEFLFKLYHKADQLYSSGSINDAGELANLIQNQLDNILKETIQ